MRELQLFREHLKKLRGEKSDLARSMLMSSVTHDGLLVARSYAQEADLLGRLMADVDELDKDPGAFVKRTGI